MDIFEIRKYYKQDLRREKIKKVKTEKSIKLIYQGLDGIKRSIEVSSESDCCIFEKNRVKFEFELESGEEKELESEYI